MTVSDMESPRRRHLIAGGFAAAAALGLGLAEKAVGATATNLSSATGQLSVAAQQANATLFPGFKQQFIKTSGAVINSLVGGEGPPLLLLHGHPATHVEWHRVAPQLAKKFTVVMTDLRGYGDSSKPDGGENHINYAKRVMGLDQVEVMRALGFQRFQAVGHDRGARVLHAMMLHYPETVERAVTLDIAPADRMYAHTDRPTIPDVALYSDVEGAPEGIRSFAC